MSEDNQIEPEQEERKMDPEVRKQIMDSLRHPTKLAEDEPAPVVRANYCPGCGQKINSSFNFCPMCGADVKTGQIAKANGAEDLVMGEKKSSASGSSLLEQVMDIKEDEDTTKEIDPQVRKEVLEKCVNLNIISGLLG